MRQANAEQVENFLFIWACYFLVDGLSHPHRTGYVLSLLTPFSYFDCHVSQNFYPLRMQLSSAGFIGT